MSNSTIIALGVAVAVVAGFLVYSRAAEASAVVANKAALEKLYGRKIPPIPPGKKWNPITGTIEPMLRITTGASRF